MKESKKTSGKSSKDGKQQMALLKKDFQSQLKTAQATAFDKGYAQAMRKVGQMLKMKSKELLNFLKKFEKELTQLSNAKAPAKTTKPKRAKKAKMTQPDYEADEQYHNEPEEAEITE